MTKKLCGRCRENLPLNKFYVCTQRRDGLTLYCKKCHRVIVDESRERRKEVKRAQRAGREARRQAEILTLSEIVKQSVVKGGKTREELYSEVSSFTEVSWDDLGDVLAELAFESQELKIVRTGARREIRAA